MRFGLSELLVVGLALIMPSAITICLQVFLSTRENKWLGRILPIITFTFSVFITAIFSLNLLAGTSAFKIINTLVITFVFTNISTAVLLLIYLICRKNLTKKSDAKKMNMQDLQDL